MTMDAKEKAPKTNSHGGRRPGAGRPRKTEQNDAHTLLAKAKAKHESYKAQMAEIAYKKEIRDLITAAEVEETVGTAFASIAQTMLALSDNLERRAGLSPDQTESVESIIHESLTELADRLSSVAPGLQT